MLTKDDLKEIRNVVKDEIRKEIQPIKQDIVKIRKDMNIVITFFDREYLELIKKS